VLHRNTGLQHFIYSVKQFIEEHNASILPKLKAVNDAIRHFIPPYRQSTTFIS
jgi:hypothetical protein